MGWLKHILTECDNETFSSPRIAGFVVLGGFIGLAVADFWTNKKFDPQAYGIGSGSVVAAFGAAIKLGEKA